MIRATAGPDKNIKSVALPRTTLSFLQSSQPMPLRALPLVPLKKPLLRKKPQTHLLGQNPKQSPLVCNPFLR